MSTTGDVDAFVRAAAEFLEVAPVDNTVLLTEATYLQARGCDGHYGWFRTEHDEVVGAFLLAPHHPPMLSQPDGRRPGPAGRGLRTG